jgi:hypothetical protein
VKPEPRRKHKGRNLGKYLGGIWVGIWVGIWGGIWGGIYLPFEVGSLVTKARGSITNVFTQSRNRHLGNEISGKRSKSWEDTRTRKAASLPRCGRAKSNNYAEPKGSDEDSRAGLWPCFFFAAATGNRSALKVLEFDRNLLFLHFYFTS